MFKKISKGFILLFVVGLVLAACSTAPSEEGKKEEDKSEENKSEVVATVNGEEITRDYYETQLEAIKTSYKNQGMNIDDLDDDMKKQMEESVLDQIINTEVLLQTAEDEGVAVEQSEVDAELEGLKSQFQDEAQYKEALEANNVSEDTLKEQLKDELTITKYLDTQIGEIKASAEEVEAAYEEYKAQVESQEQKAEELEAIQPQIEQQVIAQKKNEEVSKIIEKLRKENEENIEVLL